MRACGGNTDLEDGLHVVHRVEDFKVHVYRYGSVLHHRAHGVHAKGDLMHEVAVVHVEVDVRQAARGIEHGAQVELTPRGEGWAELEHGYSFLPKLRSASSARSYAANFWR